METAPENNKNGDLSLEKLKEALDKSSSINRALGLSFGIFIFVIAIMVASTTDLQLFIPDSTFNFPFINLPLSIVNFFLAAPFVVLIMHYNLLYNLMQHSKKLLNWHNTKIRFNEHESNGDTKSEEDLDMYPFLFNFALNVKNPIHNRTLNIVNRITIFVLPLALLCFILFRFADFQSIPITFWHFAAVLLDAALIATHSFSILKIIKTNSEPIKEEYRFMDFFNFSKQGHGFKKQWKNAGTFIFTAFPAFFASLFSLVVTLIAGIWNLITKLKFWKTGVFKSAISSQVLLYKYLRMETFMVHLAALFIIFFCYIMLNESDLGNSIRLNLHELVLVKSQPEQEMLQMHLNKDFTKEERDSVKQEIIEEYTKGYSLKGRSFRYADFTRTTLIKTDLRGVDITSAHLKHTKLQKADLKDANLSSADLSFASLQEANLDFSNSDLHGINLLGADLNGANLGDFSNANLQGANLGLLNANLQRVSFSNAYLKGVSLRYANLSRQNLFGLNLQGSDLSETSLQGADLSRAELQGADLSGAELQGADLIDASLNGANLSGANLTGAWLWWTGLQGANLSYALLDWSFISGANLQGADLSGASLQGADLSNAKLNGAIVNRTNLRGSYFDKYLVDTILLVDETDKKVASIADILPVIKTEFDSRLFDAKKRFINEKGYKTLYQRLPNVKIYHPENLKSDSTFFLIRRKIASKSKEIAKEMLKSSCTDHRKFKNYPVYQSLYFDLYKYLKAHHPDYLEGFKYDENGEEIKN